MGGNKLILLPDEFVFITLPWSAWSQGNGSHSVGLGLNAVGMGNDTEPLSLFAWLVSGVIISPRLEVKVLFPIVPGSSDNSGLYGERKGVGSCMSPSELLAVTDLRTDRPRLVKVLLIILARREGGLIWRCWSPSTSAFTFVSFDFGLELPADLNCLTFLGCVLSIRWTVLSSAKSRCW
jgi:hypothetical protein